MLRATLLATGGVMLATAAFARSPAGGSPRSSRSRSGVLSWPVVLWSSAGAIDRCPTTPRETIGRLHGSVLSMPRAAGRLLCSSTPRPEFT